MFKVNYKNLKTTPWRRTGDFTVDFEHNSTRETFARRKFRNVKNLRNFSGKLSQMVSNKAFCESLTFANVYFKW